MKPLNTEPATAAGDRQLEPTVFKYTTPQTEKPKTIVRLCRSDLLYSSVQVLKEGGENNLHAHNAQNGFWFVLSGKVRFYGEGDKVIAELGPREGIHIPRGFYYWFESVSDEVLELLQVEAVDLTAKQNLRLNATARQDPGKQVQVI
ncbi:MAG TPA: cupin domain-containing protein [Burkholderiales bacterium]|nr:cupin domain-containing protein [Burkholderiales bacterium]